MCRTKREWYGHVITNCMEEDGMVAAIEVKEGQKWIKSMNCSACGKCGARQSTCNRYREDRKGRYEGIETAC